MKVTKVIRVTTEALCNPDAVVKMFVEHVIQGALEAKEAGMPLEDTSLKVTIELNDGEESTNVSQLRR